VRFWPASSRGKEIAADAIYLAFCAAFFFTMYCLIYFVTAAFMATSHGLIKWGEGWRALKNLLGI
jgi:hypothetical protein